jgi:hypothetical protein
MKKLFSILMYCTIIAIPVPRAIASHDVMPANLTDYTVFAANQTSGNVAVYFTGANGGIRGYVAPNSGDAFGPIPAGTYTVLLVTNAPGTHTFSVNGQSATNGNGQATFTVSVTSNVYVVVQ